MTWRGIALAIALIGAPSMVAAQEHRDHGASPLKDETAAAPGAVGSVMACPMMAQHALPMGGMRAMSPRDEHGGMGPGMGRPQHRESGPGMRPGGMMEMMMPTPGPDADSRTRGRWMQMRGEMMKAMGDIMLRHGREVESGK